MSRIFHRVAYGGLLAVVLSVPPAPAGASGFGLFGPRQTTFIDAVETVYAVPTTTSYIVPTTSVVSTSYLVPTSRVVYRPARYTLAPTIYRSASVLPTRYVVGSSLLPTRYVAGSSLLPTRYYVSSGSVLRPTRYYVDDVIYPSSVVYDAPVIESAPTVYVDRPVVESSPAPRSQPAPRSRQEPPLDQGRPSNSGRGAELESRALPERQEPSSRPEPDPVTPPDLPEGPDDESIEGILPLPEPFEERREAQRPAFSVPGSTLAAASRMVEGRVRDSRSGRPVSDVIVRFSNVVPTFGERQAVTNARGEFQLDEFLPDGDWSIIVSGQDESAPTRTYPQVTVMNGRIYDRSGRDYSKVVLDY